MLCGNRKAKHLQEREIVMTLVIIEREGKDAGFATTLSNLRPAGTIIDEIILLHKASELDDSKTKVSLPRLDKIDRICFEIEDIPVEISWNTGGYDNMDTSWDYESEGAIMCFISPKSTVSTRDGAMLDRTITKVLGRILALVSGLEVMGDVERYHKVYEKYAS